MEVIIGNISIGYRMEEMEMETRDGDRGSLRT